MFKNYCASKGYFCKDAKLASHLFMDGGKVCVPDADIPTFLAKYITCVNQGEHISLVERLGDTCSMRFFLDVDKISGISCEKIIEVADSIVGSKAEAYMCSQQHGMHLVYNFVTTADVATKTAISIRNALCAPESGSIDTGVYRTGLRMLGSCKYNRKDGVFVARWYMPIGNNPGDSITMDMLKRSVVRLKTNFVSSQHRTEAKPTNNTLISSLISKIDVAYKNASVIGISEQSGGYLCVRTDSRHCTNIGCEHKSANVYFVLTPKHQLYQKCFCPCMKHIGRKHGYCCAYRSTPVQVSDANAKSLRKLLT